MTLDLSLFAAIALLPAMVGPVASEHGAGALSLSLCRGGVVSLPLQDGPPATPASQPCCAKGCHGSSRRKRAGGPEE
ncbi:conserved hypothetical protein [Altererythrobacter sp. B11]|uniref:hypothetical protein n=1 Tax=Altererythrobacter sp. B11 TaxID=2060312 RepID=UPI000DC6E716|nr:hypothetical protein [Altererythrobacter sp. B11]BBC72355.1 conserved hypothetical protein [Altererythrobacter sp. B11]